MPPAPTPAGIPPPPPLPPSPSLTPNGAPKCAIAECPQPAFVDESGQAHECCGYTHAMEHQRRLALQQRTSQDVGVIIMVLSTSLLSHFVFVETQGRVVKGLTQCLLPECQRPTWPFENYCGKTHAQQGQQRGLIRESVTGSKGGCLPYIYIMLLHLLVVYDIL